MKKTYRTREILCCKDHEYEVPKEEFDQNVCYNISNSTIKTIRRKNNKKKFLFYVSLKYYHLRKGSLLS